MSSRYNSEKLPITNAWVTQNLRFQAYPVKLPLAKKIDCLNDISFDTVENKNTELLIGTNHTNINMYTEIRSRNTNYLVPLQES